ncbi:MAG TPA: MmcQ/YjbR family DNA-binding protein [Candidatus Dormibacteraeota bacterium]|nr:MmcQ/YjbR family DNA-binding protein [Candidatus Dormibacteraeota bacterium]
MTLASAAATYPIGVVTLDEVRRFALTLPRTTEGLVAGRVKFYVGRIVYLAFSRDETVMGFAFPKDERDWLVGGTPEKFMKPSASDLRYHWVLVRLAAIEEAEMRELVLDAWRMVVPKRVGATYDLGVTAES